MRDRREAVGALLGWFAAQARELPWRRTRDPYAIWVSEVMLQQTQVRTVVRYWSRWMRAFPSVEVLAAAPVEEVLRLWAGLGYYRRARQLHAGAQAIVQRHQARFPRRFEEVLALPGVGRYTAGAVCSVAFGQPTPVLDGNVRRVLARLLAERRPSHRDPAERRLWEEAGRWVRTAAALEGPPEPMGEDGPLFAPGASPRCGELNQALMELGALVCAPRHPACSSCPVASWCAARRKNLAGAIPPPAHRPPSVRRRRFALVVFWNGRYLLAQQPPGGVNAGLWEFPSAAVDAQADDPAPWARPLVGWPVRRWKRLGQVRHQITRYAITVEVFGAALPARARPQAVGGAWHSPAELAALPLTAAHRRIASGLPGKPRRPTSGRS